MSRRLAALFADGGFIQLSGAVTTRSTDQATEDTNG